MEKEEKLKIIQDYTFQFQAMSDNLAMFTSPDDAIKVLKQMIELMEGRKQERASEEFQLAVRVGGTLVVTCEGCQRTHFATGDYSLYEKEYFMELLELSKKHPEKFIEVSAYDDIEFGELSGKTVVVDCDCPYIRNHERWFWNNRWVIQKFFENRAKLARTIAEDNSELSNSILDSLTRVE